MQHPKVRLFKGLVYLIAFFLMALSFHYEADRGVILRMSQFGIHNNIWTVLFMVAVVLVGIQTILNQRWNMITFTPYIMYACAIIIIRISSGGVALSSVSIVTVLAIMMIIDVIADWG